MRRPAVALLFFAAATVGALELEGRMVEPANRALAGIIDCKFATAMALADSLSQAEEEDPIGPLIRLLAIGLRDLDAGKVIDSAAFMASYRQTLERIEPDSLERSSYALTMSGFAHASYAAFYLNQEKYLGALGVGLDAIKALNRARELDSLNYDVDFFLGLYDYARLELKRKLWMVLFWYPGNKREGIRKLERAASRACITADASRMALVDIYIKEKRYGKARRLLDTMLVAFPQSRFIRWSLARYYEATGRQDMAAETYGALSLSYRRAAHGMYNSLVTGRKQVEALLDENREAEARSAAQTLLQECAPDGPREQQAYAQLKKLVENN